jgi:hypothetical protein
MEVSEALAIIEKIIEAHRKLIVNDYAALEKMANDASVMRGLESGIEAFMPGRHLTKDGPGELELLLASVARGLQAHFNFEETSLPGVITQYGDEDMMATLRIILQEHGDLRGRIALSEKHVSDLAGGKLSRQVWDATAHDMRAHIAHTRRLLLTHASTEQKLLQSIKNRLKAGV